MIDVATIRRNARIKWRDLKHRAWCRTADLIVAGSVYEAAQRLKKSGPISVLIDNSTLGFGVTHETAWINTGPTLFGGVTPVETGYQTRIPVHSHTNASDEYREVTYIIGIAELARRGLIELHQSSELHAERWRHPPGRFMGYGWEDLNVFAGIQIPSIDGSAVGFFEGLAGQKARLDAASDEPYRTIRRFVPDNQSFDAWHLHTANAHELFCFLTMDGPFRRQIEQAKRREGFPDLKAWPMLPSEFGKALGLRPVHSFLVSYHRQKFFVRHDLHMPDQKRRPRSTYRS